MRDQLFCGVDKRRGVQYVHWVMHKCIMVKVWGKRNTHKVCKKQVNFRNQREICKSRGKNNFLERGGKYSETGKMWGENSKVGGKIQNSGSMTKKGHQKFGRGKS